MPYLGNSQVHGISYVHLKMQPQRSVTMSKLGVLVPKYKSNWTLQCPNNRVSRYSNTWVI